MRKTLAVFLLLIASGTAVGDEWKIVGAEAHLNNDQTGMMLAVTKGPDKNGLPMLVTGNDPRCRKIGEGNPEEGHTFSLNNTRIKSVYICLRGDLAMIPQTHTGRQYMLEEIRKNDDLNIDFPSGEKVVFKNRNGRDSVVQALSVPDAI